MEYGSINIIVFVWIPYRWEDAADAFIKEAWRRNVMWYVKDDAKLGFLDTSKDYRLPNTMRGTINSRKMMPFQV